MLGLIVSAELQLPSLPAKSIPVTEEDTKQSSTTIALNSNSLST